ncbi:MULTISPECIES: hypothetical protein [Aquirufa]|jgi:hypothetical protein|uniref:Lipoprotein n=1 Tax=Aquirufa originis TaxID=3096514 RepID=A0ABW6D5W2_9BACT|nr:hypothetical protein [Aquirufa antheringensis]MCL9967774.1 hypothetical protein [Aquirufa antheringensis]MCZ2477126.1 hypothetical protein [Aquirufa antheringensis]TBH70516.1 hypothetical protein EWU21_07620 [Aquirufa antheringensis]
MKIVNFLLLILFTCLGCRKGISSFDESLNDSLSVFQNLKIVGDSLNLELKVGEKINIPLNDDFLEIEVVRISRGCYLGETSCDMSSDVLLRLSRNDIKYTLPLFDLGLGYGYKKFQFPSVNCLVEGYGHWYYSFNNLIFVIREITPYPTSRQEVLNFYNQKLYNVRFSILNKCSK